jgi:hypothetical protein
MQKGMYKDIYYSTLFNREKLHLNDCCSLVREWLHKNNSTLHSHVIEHYVDGVL